MKSSTLVSSFMVITALTFSGCQTTEVPVQNQSQNNITEETTPPPIETEEEAISLKNPPEGFLAMTPTLITIDSPTENQIVPSGPITVSGNAKPKMANKSIYAYTNLSKVESDCIDANVYASGGASRTDADGNFKFELAEFKKGKNTLILVIGEDSLTNECVSKGRMTPSLEFTYEGETPLQ